MRFDIVIPTIGRPSLYELLGSLERALGAFDGSIFIVDDRRGAPQPLEFDAVSEPLRSRIRILHGKAAGPASARNIGWRASTAPYVAFLDDDVRVERDWFQRAARDIEALGERSAGSQAIVTVPLAQHRAPTDWERNVSALARSAWITADLIYRRSILAELRGFDERFRRAYREDADLALRVRRAGYTIERGTRRTLHPVRPADPWISVRLQAGNADDVLMRALHGPQWRRDAQAPAGRWPYHLATVLCAAGWAALTADFALRRIKPGPKSPREIAAMLATSAVIPFAAAYHRVRAVAMLPAVLRRSSP